MNAITFGHIIRRSIRSLWENLYLNSVATGVIAASLLMMGVYLSVQHNLNTIVDTWSRDVHVSAYFHPDVPEARRFDTRDQIAGLPEVERVRYISESDARDWLTERVEGLEDVLDELGDEVLPASLEITLLPTSSQPATISAFTTAIDNPDFSEIDYGEEWVERFNAFLALLAMLGAILGILILVSAMFLVTNTVYLVVYNRQGALNVARLVGASDNFITIPFIIEGVVQGLIGTAIAWGGLWIVHSLLVLRMQEALQLNLAGELDLLPLNQLAMLGAVGVFLGVFAAIVAVRRFLSRAP